mmetsp:Transcript_4834/g.13662  ORF Transcript_4834/g.13662 Transcript_4834/m.13662 type:complete len:228 (-) Transcript_4834:428-1111(-)
MQIIIYHAFPKGIQTHVQGQIKNDALNHHPASKKPAIPATQSILLVLLVGVILLGHIRGSRNSGSGQIGPGRNGLGGNHGGILGGRVHGGIDPGFVLLEEILEERIVQELGTAGLRSHAPDEEGCLEGVVEWDPIQEEVDKDLNDGEEGVHDPVDEPLGIVSAGLRLDGLERLEGRVDEADDIAESSGADTEEEDEEHESTSAEGDVLLGDLGHVLLEGRESVMDVG